MNQAVASAVLARTVRRCKQRVGRVNSPAGPRNSLHPAAIPSHNVQSGLWPASTRPVGTGSHLDWPTATSSLQSTHYSSQPVFLHISTVYYHFTSRQLCLSTFEAFWSIVTLQYFSLFTFKREELTVLNPLVILRRCISFRTVIWPVLISWVLSWNTYRSQRSAKTNKCNQVI